MKPCTNKDNLSEPVRIALESYHLIQYFDVGSDCYPNIISAEIRGTELVCEYLNLDGFSHYKYYDIAGVEIITAEYFEKITGHSPVQDDLSRCNCKNAGEIGHKDCGWNFEKWLPNFMCF